MPRITPSKEPLPRQESCTAAQEPVHRHLDTLAATCAGDKSGDLTVNQCTVDRRRETHPVADDTFEEYGQVLAIKGSHLPG